MGKGAIAYAKRNTPYPFTPFSLVRSVFRAAFHSKGDIDETSTKTNQKGAHNAHVISSLRLFPTPPDPCVTLPKRTRAVG